MFDKMKQMVEFQKKAKDIQSRLESMKIERVEEGIKIIVNGLFKVEALEIDSALLNTEKKQKLESQLCKIFSNAVKDAQQRSASASKDLLQGFSL